MAKVLSRLQIMASQLTLTASDLQDMVITDHYQSRDTGVTHFYFRQQLAGLEVFNGTLHVNVDSKGAILSVNHNFVSGLKTGSLSIVPVVSAGQAVRFSSQYLGIEWVEPLVLIRRFNDPSRETLFEGGSVSRTPIPVRLMYFSGDAGRVSLVWQMAIEEKGSGLGWSLRVDALTGQVIDVNSRTWQDSYRVFPFPYVSPGQPGANHELVVDPALRVASPFGWHNVDGLPGMAFSNSQGNNVSVQEDMDANNHSGNLVEGGDNRIFNFFWEPGTSLLAASNQKAAMTNLFYWCNLLHDIFYIYGFNEESGNFQENNFFHGGQDGDRLLADAQDGAGLNNATFFTPPDGQKPRLQMFLFDEPDRDSSLDASIIIHEYAHGVSCRLVGGPSDVDCLFGVGRGLGEGWSDWWSLALTTQSQDGADTPRSIGAYAVDGDFHGPGIRNFPYTVDMNVNPHTFGDIAHLNRPHGTGEVWAVALWEVYWALVETYGFEDDLVHGSGGNIMAHSLVMNSYKLMPCGPTFLQARDAVLLADEILFDGDNRCLIWKAFARRGMGVAAWDNDDPVNFDVVENFDAPPECVCEAPAEPESLSVEAQGNNRVNLTWTPVPGALGYRIYRAIDRCPNPETDVPYDSLFGGTWLPDYQVSGGLSYSYVVTALDSSGYCESTASSCVTVVPDGHCLTPPVFNGVGFVSNAASINCEIVVSWEPASVHCGTEVSYNVYRSTHPNFEPSPFNRVASCLTDISFVDVSVEFLTPYFYLVRSENNPGFGAGPCSGTEDQNLKILDGFATGDVSDWILDPIQLPTGFWQVMPGPGGGGSGWIQEESGFLSSPLAWFCDDENLPKDQVLLYNQAISLPVGTSNFLSFHHNYYTEFHFDGGVLEYSIDLGEHWFDILAGDGNAISPNTNRFKQNGYDDVLSISSALSERAAWTGRSDGYEKVIVDMSDFAGQTMMIRWRMGTDSSVGREGWWLDDVYFYGYEDCMGFCDNVSLLYPAWPQFSILDMVGCISGQ